MSILNKTGAEADVVAVARCYRDANDLSTGEVAFTTIDEWQGAGIGTALADVLARWSCDAGIIIWKATFLNGNKGIQKVLGSVAICDSERDVGSGAVKATYRLLTSVSQQHMR